MTRFWTCQRQQDGRKCAHRNPARKRKCEACGGERQRRPRPKHLVALEAPYEHYLALNHGQERCGICLRPRSEKDRKLDRDHDHKTGRPRGLLCHRCNKRLDYAVTPEWLRAAADYLERAA